ncbi:glycosyltransferase [Pseudomonas sp. B21-023]|uniref:glycosyltransferase n=1 Tax=unclassified Pseudomonas TaxID=196821 RepID=UPI002160CFA0|nr:MULTISPECIES: glycosyltransferase [unclassified Pseudomonas]UVL17976.1 glycosyltransferase [Pseudomonas sp. B21-044]UVM15341.1 glycosyltransferase [Pseudomonas sp. B21-023]
MKKVFHLTHTDIRSDSRILKEMDVLGRAGYAVSGVGIMRDEATAIADQSVRAEVASLDIRSRKLTFVPRALKHALIFLEFFARVLPRVIRMRPDVIHCHDTLVLPLGWLLKGITRARLVYDAHELESNRNGIAPIQGKLTLLVEKLIWRFVDTLIVVSPSIERWYHDNLGQKPSAVILNSPVFAAGSQFEGEYLRTRFSIPSDKKIFIYVGILVKGRGIDLLVDAFSDPRVNAHIVFMGYGALHGELAQRASERPNVHVHEAVPHAQVVPIVQSADVGLCMIQNVSLSSYYCLPNKLFEYCFAGIPVLASDFPDIRAVLQEYGIGECCELEVGSIREAVLRMEGSQDRFEFADLRPLSWQAQERKLLALYQRMLVGAHG